MAPQYDADVLILGGGCAGLSLAAHLAAAGARTGHAPPSTLILEPRTSYGNDRTWSGWRGAPHLFSGCVSASWENWRVGAGGRIVRRGDACHAYETIPADRFYAEALRLIAGSPSITLRQGITARHTGAAAHAAWVDTSQGRLYGRIVVDTRPPPPEPGEGMLQIFTGIEIETAQDCFDPTTVDLMMFDPPSHQDVGFMYALPFSPRHALLELTRFTAGHATPPSQAEVLARISAAIGGQFAIRRIESGVLAMRPGAPPPARHPRLLALGTRGGAARAATGYAFAAIQAQAAALACRIAQDAGAGIGWRAEPLPPWLMAMDRCFLRALRANPAGGPAIFLSLFEHCPAPALTRFLSGAGSLADAGRVALALPKIPFLAALLPGARPGRALQAQPA